MFEKVNPSHPDKIADRIAGAVVDLAYRLSKKREPRIAVEVLIGHHECNIISETSIKLPQQEIQEIVERITRDKTITVRYLEVAQDKSLAANQHKKYRCGDNGIFRGVPISTEERLLTSIAQHIYKKYPFDGKYIYDLQSNKIIICQSNAKKDWLENEIYFSPAVINPLGDWTGGTDVDTGATNRKLGSDMGRAVTGGGLHGKDLSKADVSVNIYAHLKAQETGKPVELFCAIGDEYVDGRPYSEIVEIARNYIKSVGGFEKFAEWGLLV